ncbi:MAG: stage VI sporulation protein D [Bacillaceae bacterium]|nr:stage VI sporulation protein D [Bacillaceae bacterium]
MNQEGNHPFRFDLNETLWFQRGQEVSELVGIALEPDISIFNKHDYVSVRGVIELTGEYIPVQDEEDDDENEQVVSFQERSAKRYIHDVRSFEDGVNEFHYDIPVEITIPKDRVPSLDDVAVRIDHFDYELSNDHELKLQAEVLITGIGHGEEESVRDQEEFMDWESEEESFSFEFNFEQHLKSTDEFVMKEDTSSEGLFESSSSRLEEEVMEHKEAEEVAENSYESMDDEAESPSSEQQKGRDFWFKKKTQTFEEFFGHHTESNDEESEESLELYESSVIESSGIDLESSDYAESSEDREDAGYLMNMFRSDEETYAKIKLRIVQQNDTLESLAEMYQLTPSQIQQFNKMNDDQLEPGEIIYIPVKKQKT